MRFLRILFLLIVLSMVSCITYDPSLNITETVTYELPPLVEIDSSIQTVSIYPDEFDGALRINSGFNRRFSPLIGKDKEGDGHIEIRESNFRSKRVQGKDRYENDFIVSLTEFFSGEDFSDFDFSIRREQHFPLEVYQELYDLRVEEGDVLSEDGTYYTRKEEIGVEAVIIDFDMEAVLIDSETNDILLKLESGYLRSFLLYEPGEYDVSVEPGKRGEIVSKAPDEQDILEEKRRELFYSLVNRISPSTRSYIVEIRPIIGYKSWTLVYDLMKFGAWNKALERLQRDREEIAADNTRAEFDYVIGSIYHVLGDLEQAEAYLKEALPRITWGFEPVIEEQLQNIDKRRNL